MEIRDNKKTENRVMDRTCIITTLLCLAPVLLGLALYNRLPAQIPSHFDMNGEVNGYMSKPLMVFLMPLFLAAINLVCHVMLEADPKRRNYPAAMKLLVKWMIPFISWFCMSVSFCKALGVELPVSKLCVLLIAFIFIVFGNYLPKCRQNYTVGIKTPWTLSSEENWRRTHHMAGYVWLFCGLFLLAGTFLLGNPMAILLISICFALTPGLYSYLLYRKGI